MPNVVGILIPTKSISIKHHHQQQQKQLPVSWFNDKMLIHLQGSAKRCFLGCVNSLPGSAWLQLSKQPGLFADLCRPCICTKITEVMHDTILHRDLQTISFTMSLKAHWQRCRLGKSQIIKIPNRQASFTHTTRAFLVEFAPLYRFNDPIVVSDDDLSRSQVESRECDLTQRKRRT